MERGQPHPLSRRTGREGTENDRTSDDVAPVRTTYTSPRNFLLIRFAAMCNRSHENGVQFVINTIDHPPVADAVLEVGLKLTGEPFDVVVPFWIVLKLTKTSVQVPSEGALGIGIEQPRFSGKHDVIHCGAPSAN